MKKILLLTFAALAALSLDAQNLTVLHLNDTHSHVDPQRSGEYKGLGGVVEQAAYIDSVRKADGKKNVLLVHAGDFSQGTSYFTELGGDIEIDILNAAGYDVVTLGNHEFDNGAAELARRLKSLKADVVCANYDFAGTPLEGLVNPYAIVRKAGKKISVRGSDSERLNCMIAWRSRIVVTAYEKEFEEDANTGVALSNPLIRAYFSHGRNCKNCRNCIYDCRGMSKGFRRNFEQGHDIRGPCALESPFRLFTIGEVCYDKGKYF